MRGIIALDIDGTITKNKHVLETPVLNYLNHLIEEGWRLVFLTGRTFSFSRPVLSALTGAFHLAVQNGAALFELPNETLVKKHYIPTSQIPTLEEAINAEGGGLLVETGFAHDDRCYYKPADYANADADYINLRITISPEEWIALDHFNALPIQEFAVGKTFITPDQAARISQTLDSDAFSVVTIRDPFRPGGFLAHINNAATSKGKILDDFKRMQEEKLPVIAAGDDVNDISMLERADVKIVMRSAPESMHGMADIVAAPADEMGIIPALQKAVAL